MLPFWYSLGFSPICIISFFALGKSCLEEAIEIIVVECQAVVQRPCTDKHAYMSDLFTSVDLCNLDLRSFLFFIPSLKESILYSVFENQFDTAELIVSTKTLLGLIATD